MKKLLLTSLAVAAFLTFAEATEPETPAAAQTPAIEYSATGSMPFLGVARGVFTIAQTPFELCRKIWLACAVPFVDKDPIIGTCGLPFTVLIGASEGTFSVLCHTMVGTADILTLGFSSTLYSWKTFPPFIWESPWTVGQQKAFEKQTVEMIRENLKENQAALDESLDIRIQEMEQQKADLEKDIKNLKQLQKEMRENKAK